MTLLRLIFMVHSWFENSCGFDIFEKTSGNSGLPKFAAVVLKLHTCIQILQQEIFYIEFACNISKRSDFMTL